MDIDQAHRMANLYDACWEFIKAGTGQGITPDVRARLVACWGLDSARQNDDTLMLWARNFLAHNRRPRLS